MTARPSERPDRARADHLQLGTRRFWRANAALFAAGFATFAALYDVQPLLPTFTRDFGVPPGVASLAISVTTLALAFAILGAGSVSERWGRKLPIVASLAASALLTLACAAMPNFASLVAVRAVEGIALSGLPAVAMAYVGEEVEPRSLGFAMGLYIGGTALGGMCGRFLAGVVNDVAGWRAALVAIALLGCVCAAGVSALLPASRHFAPRRLSFAETRAALLGHVRDAGLPWLYAIAFAAMGAFVTAYNYVSYRLEAAPYDLSQNAIAAIFAVYLVGVAASAIMGRASDRLGYDRALALSLGLMLAGTALMLVVPLGAVIAGLAFFTFGFFGAHSIASAWVGRRGGSARAHASSLYLWAYYVGSSVVGSLGGFVYAGFGWNGALALIAVCVAAALAIALTVLRETRRS